MAKHETKAAAPDAAQGGATDPMEKVWVLLDTDHTHAGQAHKAGALLEVERHHAQAIARMKAGHSVPAPAR
jgi:hypothetical protein